MASLLDYLTKPNPVLDNSQSLEGLPTKWDPDEELTLIEWQDFTYSNLMNCFGDILKAQLSAALPGISPALTTLEREIFDEDSLDHLLTRSVVAEVSAALQRAWQECYPNTSRSIDITRGGRARNAEDNTSTPGSTQESTPAKQGQTQATNADKMFPDWAGVRKAHNLRTYVNCCPGDTKLAGKWTSAGNQHHQSYWWPIAQPSYYCDTWKTPYGYLITQTELVVFRISRDPIGPGLADNRSPRLPAASPSPSWEPLSSSPPWSRGALPSSPSRGPADRLSTSLSPSTRQQVRQRTTSITSSASHMSTDQPYSSRPKGHQSQGHQRNESDVSASSGHMSVDSRQRSSRQPSLSESMQSMSIQTESYQDDGRGGHSLPIEMKSIPWKDHGCEKLTVKLALWWLHMLAAARTERVRITKEYPPLNEWEPVTSGYRHTTTGRIIKGQAPEGSVFAYRQASHGPLTPHRGSPPGSREGAPTTPPQQTGRGEASAQCRKLLGSSPMQSSPLSSVPSESVTTTVEESCTYEGEYNRDKL